MGRIQTDFSVRVEAGLQIVGRGPEEAGREREETVTQRRIRDGRELQMVLAVGHSPLRNLEFTEIRLKGMGGSICNG